MRWRGILVASFAMSMGVPAFAQHEHPPGSTAESPTLFQSDMSVMAGMTPTDGGGGAGPGWHVMDLGVVRAAFNRQGGASGGSELESINWNMVHAGVGIGSGRLTLMLMNSLEPATFPGGGSRELFQTGESYRGRPLVDRQHPHDFFMNLSATYRQPLGPEAAAWIQFAPVGEPALGPAAFMHRASAGENPTAPIGHHWEDSTHIAFHVVTIGGGWRWIAFDASVFRGEEPDEHRWNIEGGRIDSASGRVRLFLPAGWSAEISHGFLKNPEALEPGDTHRTTAALLYGAGGQSAFAATLLWGRNDERHGTSDAYLVEGAWQATVRTQVYARAELVQKDSELLRTKGLPAAGQDAARLARIGAYTVGCLRDFDLRPGLRSGVGADLTGYTFPASLERAYGSFPLSVHAFLRLRWGASHEGHTGHAGMVM